MQCGTAGLHTFGSESETHISDLKAQHSLTSLDFKVRSLAGKKQSSGEKNRGEGTIWVLLGFSILIGISQDFLSSTVFLAAFLCGKVISREAEEKQKRRRIAEE